jgi:monoamine oxidase
VPEQIRALTRRDLLTLVGKVAGGAAMYQAMSGLGLAEESNYRGPIKLQGAPKGASVLILGAGIAGLVAALELRNAGYRVQVLEYNPVAGGRCWTLRGGDEYTELGGFRQQCGFDKGQYINPGPWRIPYHHHAMLDYCKRLGVVLEPFVQINYNAYVHSSIFARCSPTTRVTSPNCSPNACAASSSMPASPRRTWSAFSSR